MQADNWLPVPCVQGRHAHHNRYVARTKSTCERVQEQSGRRTRSIQYYARECRANQSKKPDPPSELGCQVSLPCNQVVWVSPLCKVRQASRLPNLGSHVCFLAGPQQPVHAYFTHSMHSHALPVAVLPSLPLSLPLRYRYGCTSYASFSESDGSGRLIASATRTNFTHKFTMTTASGSTRVASDLASNMIDIESPPALCIFFSWILRYYRSVPRTTSY